MALKVISGQDFCSEYQKDPDQWEVIDIREPYEYNIIRIRGAKLIPMSALEFRLEEIDWSKRVLFYCRTGSRSRFLASRVGTRQDVTDLHGGILSLYSLGCGLLEVDESKVRGYFA